MASAKLHQFWLNFNRLLFFAGNQKNYGQSTQLWSQVGTGANQGRGQFGMGQFGYGANLGLGPIWDRANLGLIWGQFGSGANLDWANSVRANFVRANMSWANLGGYDIFGRFFCAVFDNTILCSLYLHLPLSPTARNTQNKRKKIIFFWTEIFFIFYFFFQLFSFNSTGKI